MKFEIPATKVLIAIFACTLSIVSTTEYSFFDDAHRITRNATALPKTEFRRYIDVPETPRVLRRTARQDTSDSRVKHGLHHRVIIKVTRDEKHAFDFENPPEYSQVVPKFYLTNLHTADRLAENVVSIFGSILESPKSGLTYEQYSSLEIIYNAIKRRQFQMYRLLQVLDTLQNQPCIMQLHLIMTALSAELPPYLACAANFLISQNDATRLDLDTLTTVVENLNFLTGISNDEIATGGLYVKEMELNGYNGPSKITESIVGPFFVHIFTLVSNHTLPMSQPLFASMLLNLPNRDGDPIFNEYVRFVAKIAWEGRIPNWSAKNYIPTTDDDIYFLMNAMTITICQDPDVSYDIKQALWYIWNHFDRVTKDNVALSAEEAYRATQDGIHVRQLFTLITPHEFGPHANRLKVQLTEYIASHQFIIEKTLAGMNTYGYTSPKELLLAFLTRLRTRLPAEEVEIRKSVSALLSILMLKRQAWNFFGPHEGGITLWTILDTLNDSETNPQMAEYVQTILNELLAKFRLWPYVINVKLHHMNKCDTAEGCLREMLGTLLYWLPQGALSPETYIAINNLIHMITVEIDRSTAQLCDCAVTHQPYITVTSKIPSVESLVHYHATTVRPSVPSEPHSGESSEHYDTTTVRASVPGNPEPSSEESTVHYHATTVRPSVPSEPHSGESSEHYDTTTVRASVPANPEPSSEESTVHYYSTTVRPSVPSEPHSGESSEHYDTTTVRASVPANPEPSSEESTVHYHATTVRPSVPSEPHSGESSEHYDTTTVRASVPANPEPSSEESTVHYYSTTVRPSVPSEPHSGESSEHYDTTTVRASVPANPEPSSEESTVHYYSTTVRPFVPSEPHSGESSEHYDTTTVRASVPANPEPSSEESTVHYHSTTVRPSVPSEPHSGESSEHYDTTTVRASVPANPEPSSEESTVHYHSTTVRPSVPSEPHSGESSEHYDTTTVRASVPANPEPSSEESTVHYYSTTVRPSVPSEPHSGESSEHYDTTTVRASVPANPEPSSEESTVHYYSTTVRPSVPSEPHSGESSEHYDTTTVRASVPANPEPSSEESTVHYYSTTVRPSVPSEPHSGESSEHYDTTTVRASVPANPEPSSEESTVHYHSTTVRPSVPSEPHSGESSEHYDTTTVRASVPANPEPSSEESTVHYYSTTVRPSVPSEPHSGESSEHYDTTTVRPYVPASTEPPSTVHYHTTTENPEPQPRPISVHNYTTTARVLITATSEIIPEGSTVHPYTTTVGSSTQVPQVTLRFKDIITVKPDTETRIDVLPPSVDPEKGMHVYVPDLDFTSMKNAKIVENPNFPHVVTIPSIVCLQETPSTDKLKGTCEQYLSPITEILIRVYGEDYIQVLLGDEWSVHYPTRISFVVALLENAQKSDKLSKLTDDLSIIMRYKVAFRFVSSCVLLPLIANSRNLTTAIVWSNYNPKNPAACNIGSDRPHELNENVLTLPLVNPTSWLLPVDTAHPFANFLPQLPPDDPYAILIHPLTELCNTGNIRKYLGEDWNPYQYTNRGELFTSVLHILLKLESVQSNSQLYEVVRAYLTIIERSTQYIHISRSYVIRVIKQYREVHKTYVIISPSKSLTDYVQRPLEYKLPPMVYPAVSIHVKVSDWGMAYIQAPNSPASSDVVMLPSFDCLLNRPRPEDNPESRCQKDLIPISQPLQSIFGANYIQEILGNKWETLYPTRISLLVALLAEAQHNPKCVTNRELIAVINRYKAACVFVAAYVLLPLVVDSQNLNTLTVWSTIDYEDRWRSTIGIHEVDGFGPEAVILPVINPKIWLTMVNHSYPFSYLLPYVHQNDPHSITIQPLVSLFESGQIKELLGSSWNSSVFSNRGSLFVSVLRTLLTLETVKSNSDLYTLVFNYFMALVLPALYVHVPHSYVETIFHQFRVPWMEERPFENVQIPNHIPLPPLINPRKILQVIVPPFSAPVIESVRSKKLQSKIATILPSVNCLQGASRAENDEDGGDTCDSVLEFRLTEPLIEAFGDDYVEKILGEDWGSLYPTRISFLAGLLRNAVKNKIILENKNQLHKRVTSFKEALEVAAPYIFLPMLANYQKLVTRIVWLTYNYYKPWESHMGRNPPQSPDNSSVTLPLINPKIWYLPVNRHYPFSGFLPDFPSTNPYEQIIAPLRSVLTLQYLQELTDREWVPSHYVNRGVFFVSAMHTLLKFGKARMNPDLYSLVRSYYMAIEIPSLYIHIPRSYISNAIETAPGAWNVDLDGLMVALMEARTAEERRYQTVLQIFLQHEDLLKQLAIVLPSSTTTKYEFLLLIIETALKSTTIELATDITMALRACQTRILTTGAGAEVVGWLWVSRTITTTIIELPKLVTVLIPEKRIPDMHKNAYQDLLRYFKQHRHIAVTQDFSAYRYHTYGAFLRGYLNHLVYKSRVSEEAKKNIELVIPYIRYTGPGAVPMSRRNAVQAH